MTKLEWLVHRILSFTVRTRDARNDDIDYRPVWGSLRLAPIIRMVTKITELAANAAQQFVSKAQTLNRCFMLLTWVMGTSIKGTRLCS